MYVRFGRSPKNAMNKYKKKKNWAAVDKEFLAFMTLRNKIFLNRR